jgi:methyl-accepting chemotaxis protein
LGFILVCYLNGKDATNIKDPNGLALFVKFVEVCKQNGGGIVKYQWSKPGSEKPVDKYSYVKLFEPWGWIIGTGAYISDVESKILANEKKTKEKLNRSIMHVVILSIISFIIIITIIIMLINANITKPLEKIIFGLEDSTNKIENASSNLSSGASNLSNMSANQSASVEQISATIEETSVNVLNNFDNMKKLQKLGEDVEHTANNGYEQMKNLSKSMDEISQSSTQINTLVSTIDEIAFQTNLLALNAAVEAARAGEHGLGFAVVSEEVRNLATRSADESNKIREVIEKAVNQANNGTVAVNNTNESFNEIMNKIKQTMEVINETSLSSQEQKDSIEQLRRAILAVDTVTQNLSLNSDNLAKNAEDLNSQANFTYKIVTDISKMV